MTLEWRLYGGRRILRIDGKIRAPAGQDRGRAMTQDIPPDAVDRAHAQFGVVDVPLIAGRGEAIGKVVFDTEGKVAGLALEYPRRRHRLDLRRVRTLFLGNPEILGRS